MHLLRHVFFFSACAFATSLLAQTAPSPLPQDTPPYQSQINTLADTLAQEIQHLPTRKKTPPEKILVADFRNQRGQLNVLGQQLADALSDALQTRLGPGALLDRKQFAARLQSAGITPVDLQSPQVLQWQATAAGATQLITGRLSRADEPPITLSLTLTALPEATQRSIPATTLSLPPDFNDLVHQSVDWPLDPSAMSCPSAAETKGATPPKCVLCNPPSFTEAARKAKWQGNLMLKVAIDEQGQVTSAIVLIGGPYGVGEHAIETVRQWQFQPATKDGQPIRTCVPVDVTLHYY